MLQHVRKKSVYINNIKERQFSVILRLLLLKGTFTVTRARLCMSTEHNYNGLVFVTDGSDSEVCSSELTPYSIVRYLESL
jgi:hypothetical protein